MKMGESTIRSLTPANAGIFTTGGNMAADTYKTVRRDVLRDDSLAPNDPAANASPQEELAVPAPVVTTPVPAAPPPPKKTPLKKAKEIAKKS